MLGLLTLVYAFNFVDRQILGILAPSIANDLGFEDTGIGLLTGFYFAMFYTVLGLPIALLADRVNRVRVISVALAVWSGGPSQSPRACCRPCQAMHEFSLL